MVIIKKRNRSQQSITSIKIKRESTNQQHNLTEKQGHQDSVAATQPRPRAVQDPTDKASRCLSKTFGCQVDTIQTHVHAIFGQTVHQHFTKEPHSTIVDPHDSTRYRISVHAPKNLQNARAPLVCLRKATKARMFHQASHTQHSCTRNPRSRKPTKTPCSLMRRETQSPSSCVIA